jgi:hypothetical protein
MWSDKDFCALSPLAQRLYMFLLGQPNLNHAGLLPLTLTRWSRSSPGVTVDSLAIDLTELEEADYVITDEDTEEALIRTLVRNDGVWKQPRVMMAMRSDAAEIVSPKLRYRLREELLRIDTSSLKQNVREEIDALINDVVGSLPDTPPDTPGEPLPLDIPRGSADPHARAGARSSTSTSTSTSTTSHAPPATATGLATLADTPDDPTNELLIEHVRAYAEEPPPDAQLAVKQQIMRLVAQRIAPERIRAGLARLRERGVHPNLLPHLVAETTAVRRTSTTDQRVATGAALVEHYRALEA